MNFIAQFPNRKDAESFFEQISRNVGKVYLSRRKPVVTYEDERNSQGYDGEQAKALALKLGSVVRESQQYAPLA